MSIFKWQEQVNSKQRVLVRAARRAGKTHSAIMWARNAGKRVLFAAPYEAMLRPAMQHMYEMYKDEVLAYQPSRNFIAFRDGTQIDFISIHSQLDLGMRGRRVDAIVLDEVGEMTDDAVISILLCAAHIADYKVFATYTTTRRSGVERMLKLPNMEYVVYDYLDMLEDGILDAKTIRDIYISMTTKSFKQEWGPYTEPKKKEKPRKNILYKHLLDNA